MLARLASASLQGLDALAVEVEVDLSRGLPAWVMVGLPEASVREARERVRSAVLNAGFDFPLKHIAVNLSPAQLRKEGSHFDLPVAVAVLLASGQLKTTVALPFLCAELGLDGRLLPVRGVLALALFARQQGFATMIVAKENEAELAAVEGIDGLVAEHLLQVCAYLASSEVLPKAQLAAVDVQAALPDLADVRGQYQARRALEIAAAGGHHLLMSGSPGTGKSMLAQRLPSILPPLSDAQCLDVCRIASVLGETRRFQDHAPPFRAPHHTASDVALIGGGSKPQPGEVSRAHLGVLFLDELPEFSRAALEVLRQPLESGQVLISRAQQSLCFPAQFQLIAAMNPCPCGYAYHAVKSCRCSDVQIRRYQERISGPLLDRFDMQLDVPDVKQEELLSKQMAESSADVRQRVCAARQRQEQRMGLGACNARMGQLELDRDVCLDQQADAMLRQAMTKMSLSARACHRVLRVARSIADLAAQEQVEAVHLAEALQYRFSR